MIISSNGAGLCNRIKCWVSSMRIDEDCYVDWPDFVNIRPTGITVDNIPQPRKKSFPRFEDLFENKNEKSNQNFKRSVVYTRPDDVLKSNLYNCKETIKTYTDCKLVVLPEDNVDRNFIKKQLSEKSIIDLQFHKTPSNVIEIYRKIFKKIKFKKSICNIAENFYREKLENKKLLTVHVRSFPTSPLRTQRWYNIENYYKQIDRMKDDYEIIFLCADDFSIEQEFKKRYPEKIICFPKETDPMSEFGSIKNQTEAIVDLILLGKGETMLATETSTYSEVAWWLADCSPKVIKIGNVIYE